MKKIKTFIPLTLLTIATPAIVLTSCEDANKIKLDVNINSDHLRMIDAPSRATKNTNVELKYEIDSGYIEKITIRRGRDTITDFCSVSTGAKTIFIPAEQVTGDILILFEVSSLYEWEVIDNVSASLKKYSGSEDKVEIPNTIDINNKTYTVTKIGNSAFASDKKTTEVVMPNTITEIGQFAFSGCKIEKINLSTKLISIGACAFHDCKALKEISLPDTLTTVEMNAFYNCQALTDVTIPSSLRVLPSGMFCYCKGLKNIALTMDVSELGAGCFDECTTLEEISYSGTTSQWHIIKKATTWHRDVPASCVVNCSGERIPIDEA